MKSLKALAVIIFVHASLFAASAEGLVTLVCQGSVSGAASNEVQIAANQQVTVKTFLDASGVNDAYLGSPHSRIEIVKDGKTISVRPLFTQLENGNTVYARFSPWLSGAISIAGPATIRVVCPYAASSSIMLFKTSF